MANTYNTSRDRGDVYRSDVHAKRCAAFTAQDAEDWMNERATDAFESIVQELDEYFEEDAYLMESGNPNAMLDTHHRREMRQLAEQVRAMQQSLFERMRD